MSDAAPPLKRRAFAAGLVGAGFLPALVSSGAHAQAAPVEGVNYVRLLEPAATPRDGKIEVVEFFWYDCPHCNAFEPALEAWLQKRPDDVAFRRVPAWFREESFGPQQRLYYSLEALGLLPTFHRRVFTAIHRDRERLRTAEEIADFMARNGVEAEKFKAAYQSFTVQAKALQARRVADAYKIDSVPAMGVQGRYYTTGALAGMGAAPNSRVPANDRMLGVVDALIAKARAGDRG